MPSVGQERSAECEAPVGDIASKIAVKCDYEWCNERQDIDDKYKIEGKSESAFASYVKDDVTIISDWWYEYALKNIKQFGPF